MNGSYSPLFRQSVLETLTETIDRSTLQGAKEFAELATWVLSGCELWQLWQLQWGHIRPVLDGIDVAFEVHWPGKNWGPVPFPTYAWQAIQVYLIKAGRQPQPGELLFEEVA